MAKVLDCRSVFFSTYFPTQFLFTMKRAHADEDEPSVTKKRVLSGANGSPHVNGIVADHDDPKDGDNIEVVCRRQRTWPTF